MLASQFSDITVFPKFILFIIITYITLVRNEYEYDYEYDNASLIH